MSKRKFDNINDCNNIDDDVDVAPPPDSSDVITSDLHAINSSEDPDDGVDGVSHSDEATEPICKHPRLDDFHNDASNDVGQSGQNDDDDDDNVDGDNDNEDDDDERNDEISFCHKSSQVVVDEITSSGIESVNDVQVQTDEWTSSCVEEP